MGFPEQSSDNMIDNCQDLFSCFGKAGNRKGVPEREGRGSWIRAKGTEIKGYIGGGLKVPGAYFRIFYIWDRIYPVPIGMQGNGNRMVLPSNHYQWRNFLVHNLGRARSLLIVLALLSLLFLPGSFVLAGTQSGPCLLSIVPRIGQGGVKVHLTADRVLPPGKVFRLSHPERIVVDLAVSEVAPSLGQSLKLEENPYVKRIRIGNHKGEGTRMVFDLASSRELPYEVTSENNIHIITVGTAPKVSSEEGNTSSGNISTLQSVSVKEQDGITKVFMAVDGFVSRYESFMLHDPPRLVLDLFAVHSGLQENLISLSNRMIRRIRIGATRQDGLLLSLDFVKPHDFQYEIQQEEGQLVISLQPE